ncbi:TonB-dependent receptor [Chryseolinea sp. H1M3-3]|uniref:TonB-dependent receptor plug domain-containing protein n=1 Tax=Chryseolinea sp. H1M3-3 TaxID=3034144 RepID=UPI0023EC3A76|nr:TonB-dependent receptor [Chryseolinea sp. H1M3-3]
MEMKRFFYIIFCFIILPMGIYAQDHNNTTASAAVKLKKLSIEELMDVEVMSVSKRPEKLAEVASAIQVITGEDIRRSGATSIPEALRLASNLQVAQVNASQWAISARGFNNVLANKLLVMIDGRTVYTPMYAGVFWDVQNIMLEDVERIEVVSGPGGTLWGANAVNGIINIVTKNAQDTQGLLAEAGVGTELRGYGALRYGGKLSKNVYYRLYTMAYKKGSTATLEGDDANDEWTMAQSGFQLDWEGEKDQLKVQGNLYDDRPNPDGVSDIRASGQNALARWTHSFSNGSDFKIQIYYDHTWRDFRNGFAQRLKTYDVDAYHHFRLGKRQEITWGFGYRLMADRFRNLDLLRFEPGERNLHVYNIFIQDKINIVPERLDLTIGAKLEHNSYTKWQFQPSSRLAFSLTKSQTLWAAVSRAVRNPSRIDTDFLLNAAPGVPFLQGNKDFKSEEVLAYELGWRMQYETSFTLSLATFYNIYDNLRTAEPGPPPLNLPITISNGVEGNTYGVEFMGSYQPLAWWQLRGGYTFLKKELTIKPDSRDLNGGRVESNDPEHQFLIQSMMDLPGKTELGFVVRHIKELPEPRVAGYWGLDVRLAWRPNDMLEFNVVGQNILDEEHLEFIPASPTPRNMQRGIYGKIVCRF